MKPRLARQSRLWVDRRGEPESVNSALILRGSGCEQVEMGRLGRKELGILLLVLPFHLEQGPIRLSKCRDHQRSNLNQCDGPDQVPAEAKQMALNREGTVPKWPAGVPVG